MKSFKSDPRPCQAGFITSLILLLIAAGLLQGCNSAPPETEIPPTNTPPASSTPSPSITPTLALLDGDVLFLVVGLPPDQNLPIYPEPSSAADQVGQIPAASKNIRTTGNAHEGDGRQWLQIEHQGTGGWVDFSHLATQKGDLPQELIGLAQEVAFALKSASYAALVEIIHPDLCLRFSPYPYLRENDRIFCSEQLSALAGSDTQYIWGQFDGSGETIEMSFDEYHQRFVYDQDYFQPEIVGLNQDVSSGNAINNIPDIYPDGMIVEYHFPGFDPQYGGMDWRSLRLVFIQEDGEWFLAALVHGEWTI